MIFELLHSAMPDGYGEDLLPLALAKAHLGLMADDTDDDALVAALRDAAIDYVEQHCGLFLGPREDVTWLAEQFPGRDSTPIILGARPGVVLVSISWKDSSGAAVSGTLADFRVSQHGEVLPAIGKTWPGDVGGGVTITFDAGFAANSAPPTLIHAARLMLGHLWIHREAVISSGAAGETPLGVAQLCSRWRRAVI